MLKFCKYCKIERETDDFYKSTRHTGGYLHKCKFCMSKYLKERYKNHPEIYKATKERYYLKNPSARKRAQIKNNYNLSLESYQEILLKQNYSCAICKKHKDTFKRELDIDHCHIHNVVRGVLCPNCNKALGLFADSEEILKNALEYLINSNSEK